MIAALFVETNGVYFNLPNIDPWDKTRDARKYKGPHKVIAHSPCERWGRYWSGGPSALVRREKGDDDGCFASALESVRTYGGILEHPEGSPSVRTFGILTPPKGGAWIFAGDGLGWSCCVEQGHYGHPARKATWLYAVGITLPSLKWGSSSNPRSSFLDLGFHSKEERAAFYRPPKGMSQELRQKRKAWMQAKEEAEGKALCVPERLSKKERLTTPILFRDLLISLVEGTFTATPSNIQAV